MPKDLFVTWKAVICIDDNKKVTIIINYYYYYYYYQFPYATQLKTGVPVEAG
jgi:hypothetical protein